MERKASISRKTKETEVEVNLALDGSGQSEIRTGIGFLDHMLALLAKHSLINLEVRASGDKAVDFHHTVEDVGICIGQALAGALGDKKGISRFADAAVPMAETLANVSVDLSGRSFLVFRVEFETEKVGMFDTALTEEFLRALCVNAGMNLHIHVPYGKNSHHMSEAIFKALALSLRRAAALDPRIKGVPSTKGRL